MLFLKGQPLEVETMCHLIREPGRKKVRESRGNVVLFPQASPQRIGPRVAAVFRSLLGKLRPGSHRREKKRLARV